MNTARLAHQLRKNNLQLPEKVTKRDGSQVAFDIDCIERAIEGCWAGLQSSGTIPSSSVRTIVDAAAVAIASKHATAKDSGAPFPSVEQVQDLVEITLLTHGEVDAARAYMSYRDSKAVLRAGKQAGAIPPHVRDAFDADAAYFPTPMQRFAYYDKYSRFNWDLGRRETWKETVDRTIEHLKWECRYHYATHPDFGAMDLESSIPLLDEKAMQEIWADTGIPDHVWEMLRQGILNMQIMPSMRLLAMAGQAARRNSVSLYNCLAGPERYVTPEGLKTLVETAGTTQIVLNGEGRWAKAEIKEFGSQPLQEISFRPGSTATAVRHRVLATPSHRWLTINRGEVTDLKAGDKVRFVAPPESDFVLDAWIAGFGFGDGTITSQSTAQVRLCGAKNVHLSKFQSYGNCGIYSPASYDGDSVVIFHKGHFTDWKNLPSQTDVRWLASWLEGYLAADGHVVGSRIDLGSQDNDAIEFVRDIASLCGYAVVGRSISSNKETNFGTRSAPLQSLRLRRETEFWVMSIEPLDIEQTVYCAVVEDGHDFVLANGIHTGNCSTTTIDSIDSLVEILTISMSGCGVGFSVERKHVEKLYRVQRQRGHAPSTCVIEDTTEGWASALRTGLESWWSGDDVRFDYSKIRPAGAVLRTKGGRASGPEPLREMLDALRTILLSKQGSFIDTDDAHLMACWVGEAAVQGGTRRTAMISYFDWDDQKMRTIKNCEFWNDPVLKVLGNANNSAVWPHNISDLDVMNQMTEMMFGGAGEPGIFSRDSAVKTMPKRRIENLTDDQISSLASNPCGEIFLLAQEFCNLSQAISRPGDEESDLHEKVELATILGTIQSLSTRFPGLRPIWKQNCESERLLGVDLTAQNDCELLRSDNLNGGALRDRLRSTAVSANAYWAKIFGINQSAAITCNKPAGNSTGFIGAAGSGIHRAFAPYYIRRMTVGTHTPQFRVLREAGVPMQPYAGQTEATASRWWAEFPVKAPVGTPLLRDASAVEQCEFWLLNKQHWTEHNPSCTITYRLSEAIDLVKWVADHKEFIGGLSFLPADDTVYPIMPMEAISEDEYYRRLNEFPTVDYSLLWLYEREDMSEASQTLSCFAGACDTGA